MSVRSLRENSDSFLSNELRATLSRENLSMYEHTFPPSTQNSMTVFEHAVSKHPQNTMTVKEICKIAFLILFNLVGCYFMANPGLLMLKPGLEASFSIASIIQLVSLMIIDSLNNDLKDKH